MVPNPNGKPKWDAAGALLRVYHSVGTDGYEQLLGAFAGIVDETYEALSKASPSEILVAQGHAQMARRVLQLLTDAKETANRKSPAK